uniref:Uncharacterized protein n=1 Tax=Romanomermis culicivorax TaxID=13658 RepID=A0A915IF48_ROMCU
TYWLLWTSLFYYLCYVEYLYDLITVLGVAAGLLFSADGRNQKLPFPMERNAIDTALPNEKNIFVTFGWVEVTIRRLPQNCSYPFRLKLDFQAERFKLLANRSV